MRVARIFASGSVRLSDGTVVERIKLASLWATLNWLQIRKPSTFHALALKVADPTASFTTKVATELQQALLINTDQELSEEARRLLPHFIVWDNGEVSLADYRKFLKGGVNE